MEEEYSDELAEERETNEGVLGVEEPEEDEVLGGSEGKLGEDVADGHLAAPVKLVSTTKPLLHPHVIIGYILHLSNFSG